MKFIAYTSLLADKSPLALADGILETEKCWLSQVFLTLITWLRHGIRKTLYGERPAALKRSVFIWRAAGEGKSPPQCALTIPPPPAPAWHHVKEGHAGNVYELAGDDAAWTLSADELTHRNRKKVVYQNLSEVDFTPR